MSGNATYRYTETAVLSVCGVDAPRVVTSDEFDERLAATLRRVGLRPGLLEHLAGIRARRWWPEDVSFSDAAAMAGAKALAEAGVDPARVGLLIDTSVSRAHLEPSAAVAVHDALGLPTSCQNFDLANACLGFLNGMQLAAMMIDSGRIEYALVVDGEGARHTQQVTLDRLCGPDVTRDDVLEQFATLTLGSGAAAMVLGRVDAHPEGHRVVGGAMRAATQHHELCIGDLESMTTDAKGLLDAGMELSRDIWTDAKAEFDWSEMDRYVVHQVSKVHTAAMCRTIGIDPARVPLSFPDRGNMGPAAIPFTLATQVDTLQTGDRVLLMGAGSGLNACCLELAW
ncbi:MAG TPA: 3-oxoacyl-ACP synthase III [Pseudonocardia sp.]|jgi:3-oxoacyl-[acyl-carrier-protein] synthase-3|nr:3-oxoacyl-ACP synthase III [Pseudonocardia sp.]